MGVNSPSDIASGKEHIVRWTMVLRRPERSVGPELEKPFSNALCVNYDKKIEKRLEIRENLW